MSEPAPATRDMILSLIAGGLSPDEVCAMYPDIDPKIVAKLLRKALRKAPMFLNE